MSIFEPIRRPFKILDEDQSIKKGLTAHSLADLIDRGIEKLGLPSGCKVNLTLEDGTEIDDEDYFLTLPENSTLIFKSSDLDTNNELPDKKQKNQERSNLRSTTSRYKETVQQPESPPNSPLQQLLFFKPAPTPLMSAPAYSKQAQHDFSRQAQHEFSRQAQHEFSRQAQHDFSRQAQHDFSRQAQHDFIQEKYDFSIKPFKGVYTLTFTTENNIDLRRIEVEFRCFGDVEAESDYNRINGRARVFVNFSQAMHAMDALYQLGNCFYDLQISKNCIGKPTEATSYAGYSMVDMMSAIDDLSGRIKVEEKKVSAPPTRPKKENQKKIQAIPIPLKKPNIIEEVKKKAQIKDEKMLKEKLQKKEQEEMEKNASKVKDYLETDSDYKEETGFDPTQCSLCKGTCKRGIKLSCCGVRACRACAVLEVTKTRKCWRKTCDKPITTADIVNDHEMRQKVSKMVEDKAEGHFDKEWPKFA